MILPGVIASSGGVASSYESIATTTVGSGGTASVTFSSIPATFTHLQLRYLCLAASGNAVDVKIRFNGDSGANYSYHALYGTGASAASYSGTSATKIIAGANGAGNSAYTSSFAANITDILDYTSTQKNKTTRTLSGFDTNNATTSVNNETISLTSGLYFPSSIVAINSITISPDVAVNFAQYSSFALYGVKA